MNTSITKGQENQYKRFMEDVANSALTKVSPSKEGLQQLLGKGHEVQVGIASLITELSTLNRFANEEAESNYTYPDEYKGPRAITDQVEALAEILELSPTQALKYVKEILPTLELPMEAEGWFAIPSVSALASKHFAEVTDPAEQYCSAVQLIHAKISESRPFHNYCEITPDYLRVHAHTIEALERLSKSQPGDIIIVAAQLGIRHRGKSVRRAYETYVSNEFGLNSLSLGSIVLTHPKRLRYPMLAIDCAGDEFNDAFSRVPNLSISVNMIMFSARTVGHFDKGYGSASAFLPKTKS